MQTTAPLHSDSVAEAWERILEGLRPQLPSQQAFETWFRPLRPKQVGSDLIEVEVPNLFFVDWIQEHYLNLLVEVAGKGSYRLVPWPDNRKRIDIGDYYGDYRKVRSKLGWCPCVSLEEGLRRTVLYYEEHGHHYWEEDRTSEVSK